MCWRLHQSDLIDAAIPSGVHCRMHQSLSDLAALGRRINGQGADRSRGCVGEYVEEYAAEDMSGSLCDKADRVRIFNFVSDQSHRKFDGWVLAGHVMSRSDARMRSIGGDSTCFHVCGPDFADFEQRTRGISGGTTESSHHDSLLP